MGQANHPTDYNESNFLLAVVAEREGDAVALLKGLSDFELRELRKALVAARWLVDDEESLRALKRKKEEGDVAVVG